MCLCYFNVKTEIGTQSLKIITDHLGIPNSADPKRKLKVTHLTQGFAFFITWGSSQLVLKHTEVKSSCYIEADLWVLFTHYIDKTNLVMKICFPITASLSPVYFACVISNFKTV